MPKFVYAFAEGNKDLAGLLGGKGANLAEMTNLGLPVPPGFTITTEACRAYLADGFEPPSLADEVGAHLAALENRMTRRLGDPADPLLVSVRSGARFSMPGMMDTVLNVGLTDDSVPGLAAQSGDRRFAWDSYRRLIQMFGRTVLGVDGELFEGALDDVKRLRGARADVDLTAHDLAALAATYKDIVRAETGRPFPQDPAEQLRLAVRAVFESWNGQRARLYRRREHISDDLGTAVSVVAMVFGNLGPGSGTGVAFTRDPATGRRGVYGDYLRNAQGEDVVAGIRNTVPLAELEAIDGASYRRLLEIMSVLERHYRDLCDIEFTIERGKLWMLQTRVGKRTAPAAFRIAAQLVDEGLIDQDEALLRVSGAQLAQLMFPGFDAAAVEAAAAEPTGAAGAGVAARSVGGGVAGGSGVRRIARGIAASPGAAVGQAVFDQETAVAWAAQGRRVVLVRRETNPDDLGGMIAAEGILTSRGGKTSHAAVVARGMGKTCVCGAEELEIDPGGRRLTAPGGVVVREGDVLSVDGATGEVYLGEVPVVPSVVARFFGEGAGEAGKGAGAAGKGAAGVAGPAGGVPGGGDEAPAPEGGPPPTPSPDPLDLDLEQDHLDSDLVAAVGQLIAHADTVRRLGVRANADTADDAARARRFGAQGIGLCRTEHMFLGERRHHVERLILADTDDARAHALDALLPLQRSDFEALLTAMDGLPVTVRLLDPPLHEFLPDLTDLSVRVALDDDHGHPHDDDHRLLAAVRRLHEHNPMLGLRGVRLGVVVPGLFTMQVRALAEAAAARTRAGAHPRPEVMIPLVAGVRELEIVRADTLDVIAAVRDETGIDLDIPIGTMIELPRAALTAGRIAAAAEFFSFGTNDLTQTTWGFSRDDVEASFFTSYLEHGVFPVSPFETLDRDGVGRLVRLAVAEGRATRPDLTLGVCGEHGGDPDSVHFFHDTGLDYVSCSPFRIPIARLEAGRAALLRSAGGAPDGG